MITKLLDIFCMLLFIVLFVSGCVMVMDVIQTTVEKIYRYVARQFKKNTSRNVYKGLIK